MQQIYLNTPDLITCEVVGLTPGILKRDDEVKKCSSHDVSKFTCHDAAQLKAQNKQIHYFPKGLNFCFPKLTHIIINRCGLKEITSGDLRFLTRLKALKLEENEIQTLGLNLFLYNPYLERIYFAYNQISSIHPKVFESLKNLKYVSLSYNRCIEGESRFENNSPDLVRRIAKDSLNSCNWHTSKKFNENNENKGISEECEVAVNDLEHRGNVKSEEFATTKSDLEKLRKLHTETIQKHNEEIKRKNEEIMRKDKDCLTSNKEVKNKLEICKKDLDENKIEIQRKQLEIERLNKVLEEKEKKCPLATAIFHSFTTENSTSSQGTVNFYTSSEPTTLGVTTPEVSIPEVTTSEVITFEATTELTTAKNIEKSTDFTSVVIVLIVCFITTILNILIHKCMTSRKKNVTRIAENEMYNVINEESNRFDHQSNLSNINSSLHVVSEDYEIPNNLDENVYAEVQYKEVTYDHLDHLQKSKTHRKHYDVPRN